jgi:hypothetical protein
VKVKELLAVKEPELVVRHIHEFALNVENSPYGDLVACFHTSL